jgi:HEAT repeat protein
MAMSEQPVKRYHLKNIRTLLTEGFTDEELRQFCFDDPAFTPYYPHLPSGASRAELARLIVNYARQKSLLETLLAWAKEQNPARYETHQPYEVPLDDNAPADEVYFDPDLEPFLPAPEQVIAHRAALAQKAEYRRWADEFYIREESKILPLLASPYDDDSDQQRQDLLQTMRAHESLLILGEPGMGKTVALERMVWETAQADEPVVPIFVPLLFFQGDLLEAVRVALSETSKLHFDEPKTVRAFLRQARCLIMFDGLNEIPGQQRERIIGAMADFLREFSHHRYLVTSRSQDELWKKLRRANEVIKEAVVIQRITDAQARTYLMAHLGEQKGSTLQDRLDDNLRGLSHTPLLLWLIKEAGLAGEKLPDNRGELFDGFVNRMLARDARLEFKIEPSVKKRALAHLAFSLQQTHQLACERERAVEIITPVASKDNPEAVLQETLKHGLLQGEQQVRFLHQSVQEYFVALALAELVKTERRLPTWQRVGQRLLRRNLVAWVRDDWWAECFVQLAGLTEDSAWLVRELASVKPWLAFWCSVEGKPVDVETRTLVEKKTVVLLHSPEVEQRRWAVSVLNLLENLRTIEPLVGALKDTDEGVVLMAVEALAKFGESAIKPLLSVLHRSEHTRWAATRALGQIWGLAEVAKLGDKRSSNRQEAAEALGELGDIRAVEPLNAALKDSDWQVGLKAAKALRKLGGSVMELFVVALEDSDRIMRWNAVDILGELGDIRAAETLIAALNDSDKYVRRSAAKALEKLGDMRAVEPLIAALKDSDEIVRVGAAEALGKLGALLEDTALRTRAVGPLIAALKDSNKNVRLSAAKALGKLGDAQAVEPLIVALNDSDKHVRVNAAWALGELGAQLKDKVLLRAQVVGPFNAALQDSDRDVQRSVLGAMGRIGEFHFPGE